jgi:hypothetical protein
MNIDLLNETKKYFSESVIDFYNDMRHELDKDEYPDHYKELGKQLSIIDNVTSISDLIRKLDREIIVSPLAIVGEDEILDETFNNIIADYFRRVAL